MRQMMKPEKLTVIKKELTGLSVQQLTELCLRLAKYKKESKELLNYLLFDANDPLEYAEKVKKFLINDFKTLPKHYYQSSKILRKILRLMNLHAKFTASKQVQLELLIWFCKNFILHADTRTHHKALQTLFLRQIDKIIGILPKLHEDLKFDYSLEFEKLMAEASESISWLNQKSYI